MMSTKMKLIMLSLLVVFTILECRTKTSKNKKWFAARGGFARPVYSRPAYVSRPLVASYSRPWWSSYYRPYFSWRWLYGLPGYSRTYIVRHRRSCSSVCDAALPSCSFTRAKVSDDGSVECVCKDGLESKIVDNYCWTPRACVKSISGCSSIKRTIVSRVEEEVAKRR